MIAVGNKKERFFAKPRWSSLLILLRVLKGIGVLVLVCLIVDKLYDMNGIADKLTPFKFSISNENGTMKKICRSDTVFYTPSEMEGEDTK